MLLGLLTACGAPTSLPSTPPWDEPRIAVTSAPELTIGPWLPDNGALRFSLALPSTTTASLVVRAPGPWGGRVEIGAAFADPRAGDAHGRALPVRRRDASSWEVDLTEAAPPVHLQWTCRPLHTRVEPASTYHALRLEGSLWIPAHAALPRIDALGPDAPVRVRLHPDDTATGATLALGEPTTWDALGRAAFFAGPWSAVDGAAADGRELRLLAPAGEPRDLDALLPVVRRVVDALDPHLGDAVPDRLHVTVLAPSDPTRVSGYARRGGYVLEIGARRRVDEADVLALIAHEHVHLLIGHQLPFAAADEYETLWFREGVTDYLSLQALARSGALRQARLFARLSEAVSHWSANPARARRLDAAAWRTDSDARRLPYDHGFLLAAALDVALRRSADGDLWAWVDALRARGGLVTREALVETLASLGPGAAELAGWLEPGAEPPLFATFESAGLRLVERYEALPWFGLRLGTDLEGRTRVVAVDPGSPAADAGVEAGDEVLEGASAPDATEPWRLRISGRRGVRAVTLLAARGLTRRWHAVEVEGREGEYLEAFGLRTER